MKNICYLTDCMDYMPTVPDKFYDLANVDVNYGIKEGMKKNETRSKLAIAKKYEEFDDNESPSLEYFQELFRISKNQIIWGANHFISKIPYNSSCWIVWDKLNGKTDFADCELAWTSFDTAVRIFRYRWQGMLQGNMKNKEERIARCQKPVALYEWCLKKYAKPGWKIFDSHEGSGSHRIACYNLGFYYIGCEINKNIWQAQEDRFQNHIAQPECWQPEEIQEMIFSQGEYEFD